MLNWKEVANNREITKREINIWTGQNKLRISLRKLIQAGKNIVMQKADVP